MTDAKVTPEHRMEAEQLVPNTVVAANRKRAAQALANAHRAGLEEAAKVLDQRAKEFRDILEDSQTETFREDIAEAEEMAAAIRALQDAKEKLVDDKNSH